MLRKRLGFAFLSLAAVGLVGYNQHSASPPEPKKDVIASGNIGSRLPDFSMKDLQGRDISSTDIRGRVVLIDFWATWCQPCKKEMPGYQKLLDRYASRGFTVVGFKFDTMRDTEDPVRLEALTDCRPRCSTTARGYSDRKSSGLSTRMSLSPR